MKRAAFQRSAFANWDKITNINDVSKSVHKKAAEALSKLSKELGQEAQKFDLNQIQDADVKRKLDIIRSLGSAALSAAKLSQFLNITEYMTNTYRYAHLMLKRWCVSCD